MSAHRFKSKKIAKNTWQIQGEGCYTYLIMSDMGAAMIDTGFSVHNIRKYVESISCMPVRTCLNTHGHFDHTGGNGYFDKVFMSVDAVKIATIPYESLMDFDYPLNYPIDVVINGDVMDVYGRKLEVIDIPAHSPSSIAYLDSSHRILFAGDEIGDVTLVWLGHDQPYVEDYMSNLKKLIKRMDEFDIIATGHSKGVYDSSILLVNYYMAQCILDGEMGIPFELDGSEAEDFYVPEPEFKRKFVFQDTHIIFDKRFIRR